MALTNLERKAELVRRGITTTAIARRCKVSSQYVSMILHGKRRHELVERTIARLIGRDVAEVFEARSRAA